MFEIEEFVADCRGALTESLPQSAIKEILERAMSQPREIEKVLGTPESGGIHTLFRSDEITVLNMIWTPGMTLYPHDHRMWAVIGLYGGREDNSFYRRTPDGLRPAGGKNLEGRDVLMLGDRAIHSVSNPSRQFTGAIHVYGGDFFGVPRSEWDPETLSERPFDLERAKQVFADANQKYRSEQAAARSASGR
jgi:predicted metal-dependent enzyme (double-stranded beta helix superfamily)